MDSRIYPRTLRWPRIVSRLVPLGFGVILVACGGDGGGSPVEPEETINSIPVSEINRVPPPTYDALAAAFDKVVAVDPSLRQSPDRLARAVFDEVKRQQGVSSLAPARTEGLAAVKGAGVVAPVMPAEASG